MKKILSLVFVICISLCFVTTVWAYGETDNYVYDYEGILQSSDIDMLNAKLNAASNTIGAKAILITVEDLNGYTPEDYAYRIFKEYIPENNGAILLVSINEREFGIRAQGECYSKLTQGYIDDILDNLVSYMKNGEYVEAFSYYGNSISEYNDNLTTRKIEGSAKAILVCVAVSFVISLIVVLSMKAKLKTVHSQPMASSYVKQGSFDLRKSNDLFLYAHVDRRERPKNNNSGGGRSSGGGGGSRSF